MTGWQLAEVLIGVFLMGFGIGSIVTNALNQR